MSSLALMRFLESAPSRYDRGMRWLTLGRVDEIRAALVEDVIASCASGRQPVVLEIGCGTGALTSALVEAGARVTALDQNPEMLEIARSRLSDEQACELLECTASEIDRLGRASFDAVVASFSLSEMSPVERRFVLDQARSRLSPGGLLAIADEVRPRGGFARALSRILRAPQAGLAWLAVGSVSRPIEQLEEEIAASGFRLTRRRTWLAGQLALLIAVREA